MYDSGVGEMWLISWWVLGNLRAIGWCCYIMCAELWGPESGWMNFGDWTRKEGSIAVGIRGGGHM